MKIMKILSILMFISTLSFGQGVKHFPDDEDTPIGVTNNESQDRADWGPMVWTADKAGQDMLDSGAVYYPAWYCYFFSCPGGETDDGGGNGGDTPTDGNTPDGDTPTDENTPEGDTPTDENTPTDDTPTGDTPTNNTPTNDSESNSSSVKEFRSSTKANLAVAFKLNSRSIKYISKRVKTRKWKKEGNFYTYYTEGKVRGKKYYNFYITDKKPSKTNPTLAQRFALEVKKGKIICYPATSKKRKQKRGSRKSKNKKRRR